MQSENLLRADYPMEHNNNLSNSNSPINSPDQDQITNQSGGYYNNSDYLPQPSEAADFNSVPPGAFHSIQGSNITAPGSQNTLDSSSNEMTPSGGGVVGGLLSQQSITTPNTTPQHHVAAAMTVAPATQILGSTPLSQIGCPPLSLDHFGGQSPSPSSDELDSELDSNNDELGYFNGKRQKRGILPKHATSVMRAWLFQHIVVSYINFVYWPLSILFY